jgi:hypothetical protein
MEEVYLSILDKATSTLHAHLKPGSLTDASRTNLQHAFLQAEQSRGMQNRIQQKCALNRLGEWLMVLLLSRPLLKIIHRGSLLMLGGLPIGHGACSIHV